MVTWTVDTECPDTTFVVLPDVVTHLTSTVLVVKGTDKAADTVSAVAAAAADAAGSDGSIHTSACTFEYAVDELGVVAAGEGEGGSGDSSSGTAGSGGGSGSAGGVGSEGESSSSSSSSASSASQGEAGTGTWQQGDSSGVIHLHQLKVSSLLRWW